MSTDKKPPPLSLHELQQLQWLLGGVLALFSAWTVFYLDVEAWTMVGLTTLGVAAALVRPEWPAYVPTWVHRLAFPVIALTTLYDLWSAGQVLPAMVRLDLMLLLYRGISYRARRDDLQLVVLGLFLVVVAGVLSVSIAFAVQIVVFTACALALLLVVTLTDAAQGGSAPPLAKANVRPAWVAHLDWGRLLRRLREVADWRVVTLGLALFVGVVVVSGLLFLAIPRFQIESGLFLDRFIAKKARTGFSENIRFGDVNDIIQDDGLAVSIDVTDPRQMPATPYLRMLVLDEYRLEGGFRLSAGLRRATFEAERTTAQFAGTGRGRFAEAVAWTIYLESGVSRFLPLPGPFHLLRFSEAQNVQFSPRLQVVSLRNEPASMTAFRLESPVTAAVLPDAKFTLTLKEAPRDDAGRWRRSARLMLGLPLIGEDQIKLGQIADEILAGNVTMPPLEFARRAGEWLGRRHSYALGSRLPEGRGDPLVRWLGSREPGHCELFAGSFVLLARVAGYPARLVVGFKGGTWNAFSNNLTLRNRDAHAWAEIWNGENAWVRVDPTPGALSAVGDTEPTGSAAQERRLDRSWTARLESLRVFWYRRIVNFDQRTQLEIFRALKAATQRTGARLREAVEQGWRRGRAWLAQPWGAQRAATVLGGAAVVAGACWLAWKFRRDWRWQWRQRSGRRVDPVRREAGRWLRRLTGRTVSAGGEAAHAAVCAELERLRYGAPETWPEPAAVFRRARATAACAPTCPTRRG
ncbi:MAG: DUF3488 domain-containing protein [Opitutae bacterium]|nr:DUF3488 domain-containing protein [Opitutae bacterium]